MVYDFAGSYIAAEPYARFNGMLDARTELCWELHGGIEADLGLRVEIWDWQLADYSVTLAAWESEIASDCWEDTGTIVIDAEPDELDAPWTLSGPSTESGNGDETLTEMSSGVYTLSWGTVDGYIAPSPDTQSLAPAVTITFIGTYELEPGEIGTISIDPDPDHLNAPWTLSGPQNETGSGDETLSDMPTGVYTLTWADVSGYVTPIPNPETQVLAGGDAVTFGGSYVPDLEGRVVFTRTDGCGEDYLCVMNADGSDSCQWSAGYLVIYPDWSPDGQRIAGAAFLGPGGDADAIVSMNPDGTDATVLVAGDGDVSEPDWSPDNSRILFSRDSNMKRDVWVMSADGSDQLMLTNCAGNAGCPAWSPDGSKIAFISDEHGSSYDFELYTMDSDGNNVLRITDSPGVKHVPSWHPDGSRLTYSYGETSDPGDTWGIGVVDVDTGTEVSVLKDQFCNYYPCYGPLGDKIMFCSNRFAEGGDGFSICVMNADGSDIIPLTDIESEHGYLWPDWTATR